MRFGDAHVRRTQAHAKRSSWSRTMLRVDVNLNLAQLHLNYAKLFVYEQAYLRHAEPCRAAQGCAAIIEPISN